MPDVSLTTIVAAAIFVTGAMTIVFKTWRNSQPTGSIGQLLARTEKAPNHGAIDPGRFSHRDRE